MRAETLRWFAERSGRTPEQVERDVQRVLAAQPAHERGGAADEPAVDLHRELRAMAPTGEGAGATRRIGRCTFTLVVSLARVRVWVARGDEWDRAQRQRQRPMRYEVLAAALGDPEVKWRDAEPCDISAELDEAVGRAVWASRMQSAAA